MQPKEQPRTAQPCAGELPRPLGLLLVAAAWGGFGFLFGWHWWALFLLAARSGPSAAFPGAPAPRTSASSAAQSPCM